MEKTKIKIAFLSTYPPRECGIATFTESLINIFDALYVKNQVKVIAVSDNIGAYQYSPRVTFEINQFDRNSYIEAAEYINQSKIEVVSIQHECGIFGGQSGDYILDFMENVTKPIVLSLHSVLARHDKNRYSVTQRMLDLADSVVVMTNLSKKILVEKFRIDPAKINVIFHGVPNVRFDEKEEAKELLSLGGKKVLSTFGLLGPGKGIELAIESIAKLSSKRDDLLYLIIGKTHPTILRHEGESYRYSLMQMVNRLGLEKNIKFINKYLSYDELVDYLMATDIYLAPQKDLNQAVSGTVSYALGCGAAVISTRTNFAKEMLASGRGVIVERNARDMSYEIEKLLDYEDKLRKTQMAGYSYARGFDFTSVSLKFLKVLESNLLKKSLRWQLRLPDFNQLPDLRHLERMTDEIGIVQHAKYSIPDYQFGYSIDDQSRALIAVKLLSDKFGPSRHLRKLFAIYLSFFNKVIDESHGIHNYLDRRGKIADESAGEMPIARAFWALGIALKAKWITGKQKDIILALINEFQSKLEHKSIHAKAYSLLGFLALGDKEQSQKLADELVKAFHITKDKGDDDWAWFSDEMTWANGIIPLALIKAYQKLKITTYLDIANESISFLEKNCEQDGIPCPVGQKNWFKRSEEKSLFDQQPIESADMIFLYNELYQTFKKDRYLEKAKHWMGWYFGNNITSSMLYDNQTGGIRDGLMQAGVNGNEGAESIVTYLMAYLSFSKKIS